MTEESRPRFGKVVRQDGSESPIYYHPFDGQPDAFIALDPKTDEPVQLHAGDTIHFDVIGSHQTILVERPNGETREGRTHRGWEKKKEHAMREQKDPNGWIKGLVTLLTLGAFILGMVWGIHTILT